MQPRDGKDMRETRIAQSRFIVRGNRAAVSGDQRRRNAAGTTRQQVMDVLRHAPAQKFDMRGNTIAPIQSVMRNLRRPAKGKPDGANAQIIGGAPEIVITRRCGRRRRHQHRAKGNDVARLQAFRAAPHGDANARGHTIGAHMADRPRREHETDSLAVKLCAVHNRIDHYRSHAMQQNRRGDIIGAQLRNREANRKSRDQAQRETPGDALAGKGDHGNQKPGCEKRKCQLARRLERQRKIDGYPRAQRHGEPKDPTL